MSAAADPYGLGRTGHVLVGGLAVQVVQAAATNGAPQISDGGVVNAADDRIAFSPGIFMSIYGGGFAGSPSQASGAPLPSNLAATSVEIIDNGQVVNAPQFFVAPGQINAQMPFNVVGPALQVQVRTSRGVSDPVNIGLLGSAPKLFTETLDGLREAIRRACRFQFGFRRQPGTAQRNDHPISDRAGRSFSQPGDRGWRWRWELRKSAERGYNGTDRDDRGLPATVTWAGLAPYYPGLYQLNVTLPNAALSFPSTLVVQGGATPSQSGVYIDTAY